MLFRPSLTHYYVPTWDSHAREWEAYYGRESNNPYTGVRAYGATPEEAMLAFDLAFKTEREITYLYDVKKNDQEVTTPTG